MLAPLPGGPLGAELGLYNLIMAIFDQPDESAILFSPGPLYHAAPMRFCLNMLRRGAGCVVTERFEAEAALRFIERYRCSHGLWVPTMFVRMLKLPAAVRARHDVSSLTLSMHGAAPCPIPIKEQMIAWFGPTIVEYYGATEGNGLCLVNSHEWLAHKGSVGRAVLGEAHVLDASGRELAARETGLIYFSNGFEFAYHNDPEKTAAGRNADGWSTLGDIGHLDEEGYLYLTDRAAFTIISGGVNIYPQEVENRLVTHPGVLDAAVIGVPDADLVEAVKAVVQPVGGAARGPALEATLIAYCRETLSAFKCPRSIDFVDTLPREANGKLYKRLLRDRYWGGHGTRIV